MTSIAALGMVRGATPCLKILLLVPLILTIPFSQSVILVGLFAASSSIYTIIGILAGSILGMSFSEKRMPQLRGAGALMIIGIGVYYLYKFWTFSCPGGI
jgi:putative Mn2+ efflux pump MntP